MRGSIGRQQSPISRENPDGGNAWFDSSSLKGDGRLRLRSYGCWLIADTRAVGRSRLLTLSEPHHILLP